MKEPAKVSFRPELEDASLIVTWQEDAGSLGLKVAEFLNRRLEGKSFGEIEPETFFALGGVTIVNNIAQFPTSRFYSGARKDLALFSSNQPTLERHRFLSGVLDFARQHCGLDELYTVNGTAAPIAHTAPRRLLAAFNKAEFRQKLQQYGTDDLSWEGPPAISSFLLWLAQKQNIPGVSLWPEVAFYLSPTEDLAAVKSVLSFFDKRFGLGLDFTQLDSQIQAQNDKLASLRSQNPEVDKYIRTLELGLSLTEEEQLTLIRAVTEFLEKSRSYPA